MSTPAPISIGQYLIDRLCAAGARHCFGVPGDYILGFYDLMAHSQLTHIGTTREDTAAFAADGYARLQGLGALAVTYGVGALSVVNAVAGAYAENSPVVVISGAPGIGETANDPLLHHRFGPFSFQREIFQRITCAQAVLDDPLIALRQIDRVLATAQRERLPVYIELPRDRVRVPGYPLPQEPAVDDASDAAALREAVDEALNLLNHSTAPILIAGQELHRRGLQDALLHFVTRTNIPTAATLTGKSVIGERHPSYLGVYEGAMSSESARKTVEQADCLLLLGVTLNDIDTGVYTARLDPARLIRASQNEVMIRHHRYPQVRLTDFLSELARLAPRYTGTPLKLGTDSPTAPDFPRPQSAMTTARLVGRLNDALTDEFIVVADSGDCLFAATELRVHQPAAFLASAYYTTMGFAVPAALGAAIARPDRRALIVVGDGAFQMTGTELSTHARLGKASICVVFNNHGYATERFLLEGPFNDIAEWNVHEFGKIFGPLRGFEARTEEAFELAITAALAERSCPSIINVHLAPLDASPAMQRLTEHLRDRIK